MNSKKIYNPPKYARGGKLSKDDAIVKALKMGIDFDKDFHAQSFGNELSELAKESGYRKSKNSSGSLGRAFFEHLERIYDKNKAYYDDMANDKYARGGRSRKYYNNDPRLIYAKYDTKCSETGEPIKKGEKCVYYPSTKSCFSMNSKQAKEFRDYMSDLEMGYNYSWGGGIAIGGILGGYLGYKIGRARPQKYGFDTEKKIGKGLKKTFSKKKYAKGGEVNNKIYSDFQKFKNDNGYIIKNEVDENYYTKDDFNVFDFVDEETGDVSSWYLNDGVLRPINKSSWSFVYGDMFSKGGGVGYKPMDRYDRIRYFMNNLGLEVDDIQPTDTSVGIFDGWVVFKKRNDKKEVYYSISYDDLWYYMSHNGTKEDVLRDSNVVDDDFFAEGGSTYAGGGEVKVGDIVKIGNMHNNYNGVVRIESLPQKNSDKYVGVTLSATKYDKKDPSYLNARQQFTNENIELIERDYSNISHNSRKYIEWVEQGTKAYPKSTGRIRYKSKSGSTYQGGGYIELTEEEKSRLDYLQSREDSDDLTKEENVEYEALVEKYRKTKDYKGGSTYQGGGSINDFGIGDKVMYDSYRDGTREGEILREIDDKHFEIGSGFGVSMVHKDKIIGYAPKRMFGLFEQGGNIDDIVAG